MSIASSDFGDTDSGNTKDSDDFYGFEDAYSGDSGKDPEARAESPAVESDLGAAPFKARRKDRSHERIRGAAKRHKHGLAKFRVQLNTLLRSSARAGTHALCITAVPRANGGFTVLTGCTISMQPYLDLLTPQLDTMIVSSVRSSQQQARLARSIHVPKPFKELHRTLKCRVVRLGLRTAIAHCSRLYPWTEGPAAAAVARLAADTSLRAATSLRDATPVTSAAADTSAIDAGAADDVVARYGITPAQSDICADGLPTTDNVDGQAVRGGEALSYERAVREAAAIEDTCIPGSTAVIEALPIDPRRILARLLAVEYPWLAPVLAERMWTSPEGSDWADEEIHEVFKQLASVLNHQQRKDWLQQIARSSVKERAEATRLGISAAINIVRDAAKGQAADADCLVVQGAITDNAMRALTFKLLSLTFATGLMPPEGHHVMWKTDDITSLAL